MNCRTAMTLIIEYISGAFEPEATHAWHRHLCDCLDCMALLNTYQKSIEILRSLPCGEISPEARQRIRRSVQKQIAHPSPC